MSDIQSTDMAAPPCPLCSSETAIKEVLRHAERKVLFYKCKTCAVEYPVIPKQTFE